LNSNSFERLKFCTSSGNSNDSDIEKLLNEKQYKELYPRSWRTGESSHGVLLVLPRQKWGETKMSKTYAEHQMAETMALVNTLPNMKVIDTLMISTLNIGSKQLFGSGNFQLLKNKVNSNSLVSAVVFAVNMLTSVQQLELEDQLGVEVVIINLKIFFIKIQLSFNRFMTDIQ